MTTLSLTVSLATVEHLFMFRYLTVSGRTSFPLLYKAKMGLAYFLAVMIAIQYHNLNPDIDFFIQKKSKVRKQGTRVTKIRKKAVFKPYCHRQANKVTQFSYTLLPNHKDTRNSSLPFANCHHVFSLTFDTDAFILRLIVTHLFDTVTLSDTFAVIVLKSLTREL